jgi:hypothetical protein
MCKRSWKGVLDFKYEVKILRAILYWDMARDFESCISKRRQRLEGGGETYMVQEY